MSEVLTYLESKAKTPNEWLRRDPRTTHPTILELVREFRAGGGFYDDDAERFVAERLGNLPPHRQHGHEDRHPITTQLGHEIYLAKGILSDEAHAIEEEAFLSAGFRPLDQVSPANGERWTIVTGTLYVGRQVPSYGKPRQVRIAEAANGRTIYLPKGARTRGFVPSGPALIRQGW